jgi:hypothetical protein
MKWLFKFGLFAVFLGSVFLALLLCGVYADSFSLPFPRRMLVGVIGSALVFGLMSLAAALCLFRRKEKSDYAAGPSPSPRKMNEPKK